MKLILTAAVDHLGIPGDIVEVKDGVAHCTCNGEVIEEAMKVPATGPIGLEGDRGQMEYRRIRIRQE